jgi:WD domain, G-beta repeat
LSIKLLAAKEDQKPSGSGCWATASWDGTARLWALPAGLPCSQPFRHELVANSVAFSPDGKFLATGSFDKTARLWRVPVLIRDLHEMELRTWVALGAASTRRELWRPFPGASGKNCGKSCAGWSRQGPRICSLMQKGGRSARRPVSKELSL